MREMPMDFYEYIIRKSIFDSGKDVLVNPVNCVGVMGKGLALQFKKRYPKNYKAYRKYCSENRLKPGETFVYNEDGQLIFNVATKLHWRNNSSKEIVKSCLKSILDESYNRGGLSVACPLLGCGLGGLRLYDIVDEFEYAVASAYLSGIDLDFYNL